MLVAVCLFLSALGLSAGADPTPYYVGTGRYDITGPSVEVEMVRARTARQTQWQYKPVHVLFGFQMGYAMPTQIGHGIHLRQYSRAFIMADQKNTSRVVFVNADICMGTQIIKMRV
jgi:neutral ceramidase